MFPSSALTDLPAPYVHGTSQADQTQIGLPLDRFLPPYYPGSMAAWLQRLVPPGSLVLDPFGQDPYVILELARAGYRVLVTANNPIAAFILEVMASAPTPEEISEAVHALKEEIKKETAQQKEVERSVVKLSLAELKMLLERIREDLKSGNMVHREDWLSLNDGLAGHVDPNELIGWKEAMEEFDYDGALERMKGWNV